MSRGITAAEKSQPISRSREVAAECESFGLHFIVYWHSLEKFGFAWGVVGDCGVGGDCGVVGDCGGVWAVWCGGDCGGVWAVTAVRCGVGDSIFG